MDLLDPQSRKAVLSANHTADRLGHQLSIPHLLVGLLSADGSQTRILAGFGLTATVAAAHLATATSYPPGHTRIAPALRDLLLAADRDAREQHTLVAPGTLLRAVLTSGDDEVTALLTAAHTTPAHILTALDTLAPIPADVVFDQEQDVRTAGDRAHPATHPATVIPGKLPSDLAKYGHDLVQDARDGTLSPVHGRERELDRVQVILGRRTKNNPVLVGAAGVGKTAVVEALAHAIAEGRCVEALRDRPLVVLDVAAMVAGAKNRGDFEERLKKAVAAAQRINAVVFIDEIHQIVGAGAASGSMDAANLLKENLARGEFTLLGATTPEEYRKHIESDAALERRLAVVPIDAPTLEQTVDILRALRATFAAHHKVVYTADALTAAVHLTDKHVRDRQLPDKAIDALDEAGAAASIAVMRTDTPTHALYTARSKVRHRLAAAITEERYEDASPLAAKDRELTAGIITATGADLAVVDEDAIARIVAATAGVPVGTVATGTQDLLKSLEDLLSARVVGQEHAVKAVTSIVRRRRILGAERPTSLMFAGPTGVGKTELAKALADIVFAGGSADMGTDRGSLIRFDMSEFADKHTVSRLVGAPPGYVGHDAGGELTEAVRRNPHSVVLLDEVEKAHPDVFDVLLQVLEDGHLTDGAGKTVSFKDTIVVLTTNLGSGAGARTRLGFTTGNTDDLDAEARTRVIAAVKGNFRIEFINRIDEIIVFDALTKHDLTGIVANLLDRPLTQLAEKGITVKLSAAALDLLLEVGYDPAMGARPLRRAITRLLETPLSDALLAGALPAGSVAYVDVSGDRASLVILPEFPQAEAAVIEASATAR